MDCPVNIFRSLVSYKLPFHISDERLLEDYYKFANIDIKYYKNIYYKNKSKLKSRNLIIITIAIIIILIAIIILSHLFYSVFQSYLKSTQI